MARGLGSRGRLLAVGLAAGLAAVASSAAAGLAPVAAARSGGTATMALPPGLYPTQIFPLASPEAVANASYISIQDFQYLMWRPLYWFGDGSQPTINPKLSLAYLPRYSNGGRTVTITLKPHLVWSNGQPLTNRDVALWMNLLIADKTNYFNYVPGYFPDNLTAESYPAGSPDTFSLTFNRAYSHNWLLSNQLSEIIPLPQQSWDRTSTGGAVGNYDETRAGAVSVWKYLSAQSLQVGTYSTNPLWQVVDGPWHLSEYLAANGYTAFAPNDSYFAGKPHLARFAEVPYASDTAEFDAVLAGNVDYGYIPPQDVATEKASVEAKGYAIHPWVQWGINFFPLNFGNPTDGAIFRQLYFRQAMQHLVNQAEYVRQFLDGYGYPTYGPIPLRPASPYVTSTERSNPYPYSVAAARKLLRSHGWTVKADGVSTCARPGTGARDCGAGIARGKRLAMTMLYASGSTSLASTMAAMQSTLAQVGMQLTLHSEPAGNIIGIAFACDPKTGQGCNWEMADANVNGFGWTYSPDYYPTGESLFVPGAVANEGGYQNARAVALVKKTNLETGVGALDAYENYIARDLPVIWEPTQYYQISAISKRLHGVLPQDPNVQIYPENWSLSG